MLGLKWFYIKTSYTLADYRRIDVLFESVGPQTKVIKVFDPENINPPEFQQNGWQAILDNFKKYVEKK